MPTNPGGSFTVVLPADDAVINVTKTSGGTATVYSDSVLSTTLTLPVTASGPGSQTVYLPDTEEYVISVLINGQERATDAGTTRVVRCANGSALNFAVTAGPAASQPTGTFTSGFYYIPVSRGTTGTSATLNNGNLRLAPFYVPNTTVISKIGGEVTSAGEAGSKLRLGIYADNGKGYPGALVVDAGTINGDSATVQEITLGSTVTLNPGLYWIGAAVQLVTTTQPTVRTVNTQVDQPQIPVSTSAPSSNQTASSLQMTGVTGALPSTFSTTVNPSTTAARLFFKVA